MKKKLRKETIKLHDFTPAQLKVAVLWGYCGLFATPKTSEVIVNWIERHHSEEKAHLYVLLGMTANFYSSIIAKRRGPT